ncbi:MAG: VWA domain-containing protein [Clostridia bacterium]|nr:VWA domain-containing protein [Clostridia bacterium]
MGYGYWTRDSFAAYSASMGRKVDAAGRLDSRLTDQQIFTQRNLHPRLNPFGVLRECCDSEEHPETIPVILALDVTGSMGSASAEVAKKMNEVMTTLYGRIRDVEFMVMGIGDLKYDRAPIQISQFESDIRIAEQLDQVYMEHGGGGNQFESYTAAWYMGLHHTKLDCWKRGRKGLIITMGDETLNPYLPREQLARVTGDELQADVETEALYRDVSDRYDIWHIHVRHTQTDRYLQGAIDTFGRVLPQGHLITTSVDGIADALIRIITDFAQDGASGPVQAAKEIGDGEGRGLFRHIFSW